MNAAVLLFVFVVLSASSFCVTSAFLPSGENSFFAAIGKASQRRHQFPVYLTGDHRRRVVPADVVSNHIPQHTLLPPMLLNFDTKGFAQSWEIAGSAVVTDSYVRLTPGVHSRHGCLQNLIPNDFEDKWVFRVGFRVRGKNKMGADGLAMWYTKQPNQCTLDNSIFGHNGSFEGVGILFDTYDNDHRKDNPQVLIIGSGDAHNAAADYMSTSLGNCKYNFRKNFDETVVVHVIARYDEGQLSVSLGSIDDGLFTCATAEVKLPAGYYFALSALTGGLADEHDVFYAAVSSVHSATDEDHEAKLRDGAALEFQERQKMLKGGLEEEDG
jgi:mannose-binding lectin 1